MDLCAITAECSQGKNHNQPTPSGEQRRRWKRVNLYICLVLLWFSSVAKFFLFRLTSTCPLKTNPDFSGRTHTNKENTHMHTHTDTHVLGKQTWLYLSAVQLNLLSIQILAFRLLHVLSLWSRSFRFDTEQRWERTVLFCHRSDMYNESGDKTDA